jgi:DNA polymerase (family 10)
MAPPSPGATPGTAPDAPAPSNARLAAAFQAVADYTAFEGASKYRVIAYEKAAALFREYPVSVATLAAKGGLRTLPGIGEALEAKVLEYMETGTLRVLEDMRTRYPEGVLELMHLPGVGPRTAHGLWDALGVADVEGLRRACEQGRVRGLPRMGGKTEANLLQTTAAYLVRSDRSLLGAVEPQASELVAALRALPAVEAADYAGSLRRRRSTVRDIDLVVASVDPEAVMEAFAGRPELASINERGPTKLSARTHTDLGVDLRVVPPESYGNLLQHFTGSAQHNVALRGFAQRHGFKVSEYHVEETATGRRITCHREEEVYSTLGLAFIPPELREDRGELAAAKEGTLPRLITLEDLRGDLHVHSTWSDGKATMEEMAVAARAGGRDYLCFCDHSPSIGMVGGLTVERLHEQVQAIRALDAHMEGINLLAGVEVDILADGRLDLPDEALALLDYVTASIHSGFHQTQDQIMGRLLGAVENPYVRAISHPTGRLLGRRDAYRIDIDCLAARAAETGTFLEINAAYHRLDLSDVHARRARDLGVRLVIASDAHSSGGFGLLRYGVGEARRGWIEARDVANTQPLEVLKRELAGGTLAPQARRYDNQT